MVLYYDACSGHLSVPNSTGKSTVLGRSDSCKRTLLKHKAMLAGQRSSRKLCRWLRRGKRCTQAQCPQPPGAALHPFPRPACVIWCLVCLCWQSCDSDKRRRGRGCGAAGPPRRACLQWIDASRAVRPPPFPHGRPTQHTALPPPLRATGINTNNGVRGRGRGSGASGWGCGRRSSVHARVHASTHPFLVSRMCNIEDKCLKQAILS